MDVIVGHWVFWDQDNEQFAIGILCRHTLDKVCVGYQDEEGQDQLKFQTIHTILYVTPKNTYKYPYKNMMIEGYNPHVCED